MGQVKKEVIRQFLGKDAKIRPRFFGGFNITTPTGGDIDIHSDDQMTIHAGGEDVYAAVILLGAHLWGHVSATGSHEHIVASLAHGEALDVNVTPRVKQSGDGCLLFFVVFCVFAISLRITSSLVAPDEEAVGLVVAAALSGWVWHLLKSALKREELRRAQTLRFQYPRVHGDRRQALREHAKREEWL